MTPEQRLQAALTEIARRRVTIEHAPPGPWVATTWGVRVVDAEDVVLEDGAARTATLAFIADNDPQHILAVLDLHETFLRQVDRWMLDRLERPAVIPTLIKAVLDLYAPLGVRVVA